MKISTFLIALSITATTAFAADHEKKAPSPAQQAQQEKMKTCNADAGKKELKGDERKQFMSDCLKGDKK
jgi:psiF repeat